MTRYEEDSGRNALPMQTKALEMEENKIVIYQTEDGQTQIDVRLENDTVWLTQAQMAELFQKHQSVVARHINNALKEGELDESNMHFLHNTQYKYRPTSFVEPEV